MSRKEAVAKHFNGNLWVALAFLVLLAGLFYAWKEIGAMEERLQSAEATGQVSMDLANMAYIGNNKAKVELDELKKDQEGRDYGKHKTNFPKHTNKP